MTTERRRALLALVAAIGAPAALRLALAQSAAQGVRRVTGEVRVNRLPVVAGSIVRPGDTIEVGKEALAAFVVDQNAFLMRSNSRAELSGGAVLAAVRLVTGGLLSVFGGGEHRLTTATATVGIRGTGAYMEAEAERTYFCLCYGTAEVQAAKGGARASYSTTHHESPKYVYGDGRKDAIVPAGVSNHTDAELIMLESLVERTPPPAFMHSPFRY